jgi:hypothetical protein
VTRTRQAFTAIPYATWANRGRGEMIVWLATADAAARVLPLPTVATSSTVTTSPSRRWSGAINDGGEPTASDDPSMYFDWWPKKGSEEWVEYAFARPSTVSQVQLYWFDDTGRGQVRAPASWRLLYKDGDAWKPVAPAGEYGVARDAWNTLRFAPVTTTGLRVEVTLQKEWSAGIQEWRVR